MFDELVQKLRQCPQADYEIGETFIRVFAGGPKGFPVMIEWLWDTHFTVFLDGWHQDFVTYQEAVRCFALAVSGHYRLKTRSKGGFRFRWTVAVLGRLRLGRGLHDDRSLLYHLEAYEYELLAQRPALRRCDGYVPASMELGCCLVTGSDMI